MVKSLIKISITIICISFIQSCNKINKFDNHIKVNNNYDKSVYYSIVHSYPDTSLYGRGTGPRVYAFQYKVGASSSNRFNIKSSWENLFSELPQDTLMVFIFDANILELRGWEYAQKNYQILQRYDLSIEDLNRIDFNITYPPHDSMKGIKMYPAYKEQ